MSHSVLFSVWKILIYFVLLILHVEKKMKRTIENEVNYNIQHGVYEEQSYMKKIKPEKEMDSSIYCDEENLHACGLCTQHVDKDHYPGGTYIGPENYDDIYCHAICESSGDRCKRKNLMYRGLGFFCRQHKIEKEGFFGQQYPNFRRSVDMNQHLSLSKLVNRNFNKMIILNQFKLTKILMRRSITMIFKQRNSRLN